MQILFKVCLTLCNPMDCVAHQAPPSTGFSRQEYWSGLLFPSPGDRPDPGIEPGSPALRADALPSEPPGKSLIVDYSRKINTHIGFLSPAKILFQNIHVCIIYRDTVIGHNSDFSLSSNLISYLRHFLCF